MSFVRNISLAALAIAFAVQADITGSVDVLQTVDGALDINTSNPSVDAGLITPLAGASVQLGEREDLNLDLEPLADVDVNIPEIPTVIPARHRKGKRQGSPLAEVNTVFTTLESTVTPLVNSIESTLGDLTVDASAIVSQVESDLSSIVSAVESTLSGLNGLTDVTKIIPVRRDAVSSQEIANLAQGVLSSVSGVIVTINGAVGSVPGLGPVVEDAATKLETTLSSVLNVLGQVAAPVLAALNGLLSPLESTLNAAGLGSVVGVVQGLLGSL